MACQLPAECLNDIIEYLEKDKNTLYSCLLVSRTWCNISVRILWRNIWSFKYPLIRQKSLMLISTLFACLPNESKELLHENGFDISMLTSIPPLFNYAAFCKVLSINMACRMVNNVFKDE